MICNSASDILKKSEAIFEHHHQFEENVSKTKSWIEEAWKVIRSNINSEGKTKEDLHSQLDKLRQLNSNQEEGQSFLHAASDWGEKACRNSRSDGKDKINSTLKDLQADWEKLLKKMSSAKVAIETDLLQWSDTQQSVSRLQEWIVDRESRLKQVSQQRTVMITRRNTLGITTLSVSDRQASLRRTNSILQDIQAFEPMIQTVASSVQSSENSDITSKYQNLTKHAQEMYEREKDMVAKHEKFIEAGNDFMTWLKICQEKLDKCSEPTGDKESLASKSSQLRVLESDKKTGEKKLDVALTAAAEACKMALDDDQLIIEEEVAFLQDEFDQYNGDLARCKTILEGGIVKWTDYQELYQDALEWLDKTESSFQSFNKYQSTVAEKKKILEEFQLKLQNIFDWQKDLDALNKKGQSLIENCADSRVSSAITQLSTKYQALISLGKEVVRGLEVNYQEHHQHAVLSKEFRSWIDQMRDSLGQYRVAENTQQDLEQKLNGVKNIRTLMEQGQNKVRYLQDLKERVILSTDQNGVQLITDETKALNTDFDNLISEVHAVRTNLSSRFELLADLEKSNKLVFEWIEEIEGKISMDSSLLNDLGEKKAVLEKFKTIEKDIVSFTQIVEKLDSRIKDHPNIPNESYMETITKFSNIKTGVTQRIEKLKEHVSMHESYRDSFNEAVDYIRKVKLSLQMYGNFQGESNEVAEKEAKLNHLIDEFSDGDNLLRNVARYGAAVANTSGVEGKEQVKQEEHQLRYDWDQARNQAKAYQKSIKKCVEAWSEFEKSEESMKAWLRSYQPKVEALSDKDTIESVQAVHDEVVKQKYEMDTLKDKCELLMEHSSQNEIRERTVSIQTTFTQMYSKLQSMVSKAEQGMSNHSDFEHCKTVFNEWFDIAQGTLTDNLNTKGSEHELKQRLESIKGVAARMTEGQHLLNITSESLAKVLAANPADSLDEMKAEMKQLRDSFEQLNLDVTNGMSSVKHAVNRWSSYQATIKELQDWTTETEQSLEQFPSSGGVSGEMKTLLQKIKYIESQIDEKLQSMDSLKLETSELATDNAQVSGDYDQLYQRLSSCQATSKQVKEKLESEIEEHSSYNSSMQDIEKWLLQISFQLMASNSLYITSKEMTQQHLEQHEQLMNEMKAYQSTLDDVRAVGEELGQKTEGGSSEQKGVIEKQHHNIQESYNSLLQTATQIKNRLTDSLEKFEEYEDTLKNILDNIGKMEEEIEDLVSRPVANLGDVDQELESLKLMHSKIQNEKSRLSSAIQACEAATASISRPSSPADGPNGQLKKEAEAKLKLDELSDQVRLIYLIDFACYSSCIIDYCLVVCHFIYFLNARMRPMHKG